MSLQGLVNLLRQSREFASVGQKIATKRGHLVAGLSGGQRSVFLATIYDPRRVMLIVTPGLSQGEKLAQDLASLLPGRTVLFWEGNELMPYEEALPALDLRAQRLEVLQRSRQAGTVIIAPIQGLLEGLTAPDRFLKSQFSINWSSRFEPSELAERLVGLGYERRPQVEGFGQFAIRGGIVDIAPFQADNPVRIELFGDEVDSLRKFDFATQKSIENIKEVTVGPARETVYTREEAAALQEELWRRAKKQNQRLHGLGLAQEADDLLSQIARHLEFLAEHSYFAGIDQYKAVLGEVAALPDYLPADALVVLDEPLRLKEAADNLSLEIAENLSQLLEKGKILPEVRSLYWDWNKLWAKFKTFPTVYLSVLGKRIAGMDEVQTTTSLGLRAPEHFSGRLEKMLSGIKKWRQEHYRILILTSTFERGQRIIELLRAEEIPCTYTEDVDGKLKAGNCIVAPGDLQTGFEFSQNKLVVLTELELFGRKRPKARVSKVEEGLKIAPHELKEGDYVVHLNHGIGQYLGIEALQVQGRTKDYLHIRYAGKDRLYVPTDQLHLLQRYVGLEDTAPRLSRLGGGEWARVKKRAKESVQEMAAGLLKLYAEREAIKGFAHPPDTPWQRDFESAFPYRETPDQLEAIAAVKKDMEKPRPMDRLLCGDVGYGKTEVAIRAAFKAVSNGKQVGVLVPTTILAQQHHRTFLERFEGYPMKIEALSRFQSPGEINKTLEGVRKGLVDIVIGTHRLLSRDVQFKDLGLVVVDEEQRFGVAQKERLKEISKDVDVLTLSATPIPRTLHMAMVGVRDMSLIETPPEDRYPIRTYVLEYDERTVRQAILRELARQGQVYFVHNRIQSIDYVYSELQKLVPEARIAVAHGRMDEAVLERVMLDFYRGEYDVLLCTTIIETGMDIGNVNTLIIDNADYLGLAQLYQLRGRVGRTNRVAYAYFTYRKDRILSEDAEKRLTAIKEFTELGSGIKIAMRDLEIRGAGNLLGPEQHGFITSVGFELYCRLLEESIEELKGESKAAPPEPVLELAVNAYISDSYVADPAQKVELYQKIIALSSLEECDELEEEIQDRFGDLPEPVRNLVQVARIKVLARFLGVAAITAQDGRFVLRFLEGLDLGKRVNSGLKRLFANKVAFRRGRTARLMVQKDPQDQLALAFLAEVLVALHNE
ncbi:MAG TPA: transcription-repair coupling factor [Firmicutes bacterium]|nr:transcription-repair coupling factor [Bacillota bacterium]